MLELSISLRVLLGRDPRAAIRCDRRAGGIGSGV